MKFVIPTYCPLRPIWAGLFTHRADPRADRVQALRSKYRRAVKSPRDRFLMEVLSLGWPAIVAWHCRPVESRVWWCCARASRAG
jgi:hypothetical protein